MSKSKIAGVIALAAGFAIASSAMAATYTFTKTLKVGSTGVEVLNLQKVLNSSADTQVSSVGAGSPGNETTYFGNATKAAVIKFQEKYASDILAPVGLTKGTGLVGAATRAHLNGVTVTGTTSTGCTTAFDPATGKPCSGSTSTTVTGAGVAVNSVAQPANGLAIQGSARVPFTKFSLTAGSSDVVVNGVTVERQGAAMDVVFSGVTLLDENGMQLGTAKTFGSTHQAIVGGTFTVKAGTTKTFTVAGNMGSSLANYSGQVASLAVTGVNTTGTVTGSLPIVGASQTINGTLTIGSVQGSISSFDPATAQTKEIGTTGYKFSAVRLTAGSAEDVRLKSVRFYQAGSVNNSDLANVKISVDGTAYDTTVSADGKYYSASFGSGLVIAKGNAKDLWISGDIVGTNASGRNVDFDIEETTDVYVTGETYGQGINLSGSASGNFNSASTPVLNGYVVTISTGSVTSVAKANSVPAQNIAVNLLNQTLGGFTTDVKGEGLTVQSQTFSIATSSAATGLLTQISLVNENGSVVAGPVDAVANGNAQTVTFTDSVTFPIGQHTYTLKGKVPSTAANGAVIVASLTGWTNIKGDTTGKTVSYTTGTVAMNAMTVKAASLALATASTPAAQTVVAGGTQTTFANFQFDASQSGEDVRFSSIALTPTNVTGISTCQLYDGSTALNTGSNVVNPTATSAQTFTFDAPLTVAKNTVKTVTLKCNTTSSATGSYTWSGSNPTVTGAVSGTTVTAITGSLSASAAQNLVSGGSLAVSTSPSTPSFAIAAAGTTGNTAGVIRFRATNEGVNLSKLGLTLTSGAAVDLVQVSIWDGATQVGTATFTGSNTQATSTLSSTVVLPKDADKDITVKVDFAQVGTGYTGRQGDTVAVDFYAAEGTGANSGTTVLGAGQTSVAGVRLFKSFPVVSLDTLSGTGVGDGKLMRFKVTANANGGVGLGTVKFNIATSTASVATIYLTGYTDAGYSSAISGFTSGRLNQTAANAVAGVVTINPASPVEIPAGATYYFELTGAVSGVTTGASVSTTLLGDTTTTVATSTAVAATSSNNFLWAGNATTTSSFIHADWANGYGVSGLPAGGLIQTRSN